MLDYFVQQAETVLMGHIAGVALAIDSDFVCFPMQKVPLPIYGYHQSFGQDTVLSLHLIRFLQCSASSRVLVYSGSQAVLPIHRLLLVEKSGKGTILYEYLNYP